MAWLDGRSFLIRLDVRFDLNLTMTLISNSSRVLDEICLPCPGTHKHEAIEGTNTKLSQVYPVLFAHRFRKGLQAEAAVLDSKWFMYPSQAIVLEEST